MPGRDFAAKDVWAASFPHFAARQRVQRVDSKVAVRFFVAAVVVVAIQLEAAALLVEEIVEGPAELVEEPVAVELVGVVVVVAVDTAAVDRVVISVPGVVAVEVNTGDWVGIAEEVGSMLEGHNMFEVALAEVADSMLVARLGEDSKVVAAEDSNSLVVIRRREPLREKVVTMFVASVQVAGTLGFPKEKGLRVEEQDT